MKYYTVFVWGNIEPNVSEAFFTEEERDEHAKYLREEHGRDHGIYMLNIDNNGIPQMGAYSGEFFNEDIEE